MSGHRVTRRQFLGTSLVSTLGFALSPAMQNLLAREGPARRAKACILIWLNGGPSHIDTFDPKPGAPTNGPFKAINTRTPGMQLCEHLPKLAEQSKHLAILRSLTSPEADHDRAYQFLHTGNILDQTVEFPALGSVVARERGEEAGDLPPFVGINGASPGAGFFGVEYSPFVVGDINAPLSSIDLPEGVDEDRLSRRLKSLEGLNKEFARTSSPQRVAEVERFTTRAVRFRKSPALKAFDLTPEKPATLALYGIPEKPPEKPAPKEGEEQKPEEPPPPFPRACLMGRRLIEHGVRFVEVMLDGWDTHENNFDQVATLLKVLDPAFAGLTADLSQRGLLDSTLVLCLGEFGRTPEINPQNGRDHHSQVFSSVLAGGGIKGGQVVGASDAKGEKVKDHPVTVPDLYATLLTAFGLDPAKVYRSPGGRPIKLADKGKVVRELFA
jgi:hypothetical protein